VYRELHAARDHAALARLALEHREYLARCCADPEFAPRLAQAFGAAGMLTRELELFDYLEERSWAAGAAPFFAARLVEDALTLGRLSLAESAGAGFLERFPNERRAGRVREQLGRVAFEQGDLKGVIARLAFLNAAGVKKPEFPESDYYLGKALAQAGEHRGAERSLARFTAGAPAGSPLLLDGWFALAESRLAQKQYQGALAAYQRGAESATGESAEQFLYKMGELYLKLDRVRQAAAAWEKAAGGGAGTWSKLAAQALSDLNWRLKISGELP
jgi:tetratricopeptide (TPR) repeat protein